MEARFNTRLHTLRQELGLVAVRKEQKQANDRLQHSVDQANQAAKDIAQSVRKELSSSRELFPALEQVVKQKLEAVASIFKAG